MSFSTSRMLNIMDPANTTQMDEIDVLATPLPLNGVQSANDVIPVTPALETEYKNEIQDILSGGFSDFSTNAETATRHYQQARHRLMRTRSLPRAEALQGTQSFFDPASASAEDDSHTLQLAANQTAAARACLYWPTARLDHQLKIAASGLLDFIAFLETQPNSDALLIGLAARLLGPEGLNPVERPSGTQKQEEWAAICRDTLVKHLGNIGKGSEENSTGPEFSHSRAVTIALLGDVGALMTDTGATTGTERSADVSRGLRNAFSEFALNLQGMSRIDNADAQQLVDESVRRALESGGGSVVGPTKKKERIRISEEELQPRTGIHDTGADIDEVFGIDEKNRLPKTKWATARIHSGRLSFIQEPLVGHMSASPSEILWTWDVLAKRGLAAAYTNTDGGSINARAAGACAFLVGCGYHSALEVLHGAMVYLGQSPHPDVLRDAANDTGIPAADAGAIFHAGAATDLVSELLQETTSGEGLRAIENFSQERSSFLRMRTI